MTTIFGYDDIDQLTSESRTGYSASYTYDANGNRLTRTVGGTTENYTYDDADKLEEIKVGGVTVKSYGYDTAGRTTSVVTSGGTTTLAYDYESRISTITYPSTATNTFTYNGLDTRVGKVDSAGTATYKRDGAGVTAPVLTDGSATYTPGVSERRSSTSTWFHSGIKNAVEQTSSTPASTATRVYDAFGNVASSSGTWKSPFGYAGGFGYQEDADSGLKLLGHRYYDSSTGRFLTRDSAKDGKNWYVYCWSNPTLKFDPAGMWGITLRITVGALLAPIAGQLWGDLGVGASYGSSGLHVGLTGSVGAGVGPGLGVSAGWPIIGLSTGEGFAKAQHVDSVVLSGFGGWGGGAGGQIDLGSTNSLNNGDPAGGGGGLSGGGWVGPTFGGGLALGQARTFYLPVL